MEQEVKQCQNCKKDFVIEQEDFNFYEKIKVPPPTFCFDCRLKRKMNRRNERTFYKRKCDLCNNDIISMYISDVAFIVYCPKCWWSDKWDPKSYGVDYDFSKPFFDQWKNICTLVPRSSLYQRNLINSPYSNHTENIKNSYMVINSAYTENSLYGKWSVNSKDLVDFDVDWYSEFCYELVENKRCAKSSFLMMCKNCIDCAYLYNCQECIDCFLSSNLRNKKYFFKNKQLSKEEYKKSVNEFQYTFSNRVKALNIYDNEILLNAVRKYMTSSKQINCSGDYIFTGSKNLKKCFHVSQSEDSAYCVDSANLKNCYDTYESALTGCEQQYECHAGNHLSRSSFCSVTYNSHDLEYCEMCYDSAYLFGCIGLRSKQYCILNKQYTKEQYEELLPKIIKHMSDMPYIDSKGRVYKYGEFFPPELSPFAYNETIAQEYFPLTKEEAVKQGYKWKDKEERNYAIDIKNEEIQDNIKEVKDDIVGKVIECFHKGTCNEQCTEAFKIIPDELKFYQRMNLPIPRFCPNCRHYNRLKQRNPLELWHRHCMKPNCPNEFETSYSPDRPEIIYCERCYQQEVY